MTTIQIILAVLLGALILFLIVLLLNTAVRSVCARRLTTSPKAPDAERCQHYAQRLSRMIQCRTVSVKDSYDDTEFARLRDVMAELFPLVSERAVKMTFSDDCWIYRVPGKDNSRNIMLMSHHDVVAADGEWQHEPFSGEIADGKIWGRGTVDTKTPLFAEFSALEELLAEGFEPPCNIWLGSSHNEELGGDGIPEALKYFKANNIAFEVILDEGGAIIEPPLGGMKCEKCAMVAVHEKGRGLINCIASTESGYAGLTSAAKATPVERMSSFISEISTSNIFIRRLNPQIKAMFRHLAPYCSFPMNILFSNLWCFGGLLEKIMPKLNAQAGGLIGTTCAAYEIQGSSESKQCTAKLSMRGVDEQDIAKDFETLSAVAEKHGVSVAFDDTSEYHAPADMTRPAFAYTMACIGKVFPQYPAAPFILPAGTDARTLTDVCPCVLRFAPIRLSKEQLASVHSDNENIDVDAIPVCVDFYRQFLCGYH